MCGDEVEKVWSRPPSQFDAELLNALDAALIHGSTLGRCASTRRWLVDIDEAVLLGLELLAWDL